MASPRNLSLLGVDYGRKRTGLAMSDPGGRLAFPLGTLTCRGIDDLAARIHERAEAHEVSGLVLGYPRHIDGRPGDLAPEVDELAARLRDRDLSVILWDESLTTWEAETRMRGRPGGAGKGGKAGIDAIAAAILLQSYLDSLGGR